MNLLLVNPSNRHIVTSGTSSFIDSFVKDNPVPPLGLMYIASYMEKCGNKVQILDLNVDDSIFPMRTLEKELYSFRPDMVGITTTTLTLYDALQVAKTVKKIDSLITVVIGGAHCNIYPHETAALGHFDYVVIGEGEVQLGTIIDGECNEVIADFEPVPYNIDYLPFPARHLIDITKYHSVMYEGKPTTSMITSRGCPFSCRFCYQPSFKRKRWRARSAANVFGEMLEIKQMGIDEIEIYDDTFTYDKSRVMELCELILVRELKIDWNIRTRVDCVDKEMLQIMARAGCKRINYGIESANTEILKVLHKGFTVDQSEQAIKWTNETGIEIQAYFMIGSPTETKEQILNTIEFGDKIHGYCYYSITTPLPGTAIYEQGLKENRYGDFWREFANKPTPNFKARFWYDEQKEEMVRLMEYGYKRFYSKPRVILDQLSKIKSANEFVNKLKVAKNLFVGG